MADTPWDGFADVAYLQATDILLGLRGAGGINFTADALLFKDANGRVGLGATASSKARMIIQGLGQEVANLTDAGNHDDSLFLRGNGVSAGSGGALLFGTTFGNQTPFAAIKGSVADGGSNTMGDLAISLRTAVADTALTSRVWFKRDGKVGIGTNAPSQMLHVLGGIAFGTASQGLLTHNGTNLEVTATIGHAITYIEAGKAEITTIGGVQKLITETNDIRPGVDNSLSCGTSGFRWTVIYAASGTINTSDEREKLWIEWSQDRHTVDRRVARRILDELGWYQWRDAVAEKGEDGARWHFGARAQRVWAIVADEGLCAPLVSDADFGMVPDPAWEGAPPPAWLCYDIWKDKFELERVMRTRVERTPVCVPYDGLFDAQGNPAVRWEYEEEEVEEWAETGELLLVRPAGNRFGFRVDQLGLLLNWALHERQVEEEARMAALEARLAALEEQAA